MSMRSFEAEMLAEARVVSKNKKLRRQDIVEWSTGPCKQMHGEMRYHLPKLGVNVAVLVTGKKAKEVA